jgi:hypothetical protein
VRDVQVKARTEIPRQCPFVIRVKVRWGEGEALGSEEGKALGSGFCCEQEKMLRTVFTVLYRNFRINVGVDCIRVNFEFILQRLSKDIML